MCFAIRLIIVTERREIGAHLVRRSRDTSRTARFFYVSRHGWSAFKWTKLIVTLRAETLMRGRVERREIEPDRAATSHDLK